MWWSSVAPRDGILSSFLPRPYLNVCGCSRILSPPLLNSALDNITCTNILSCCFLSLKWSPDYTYWKYFISSAKTWCPQDAKHSWLCFSLMLLKNHLYQFPNLVLLTILVVIIVTILVTLCIQLLCKTVKYEWQKRKLFLKEQSFESERLKGKLF